MVMWRVGEDDTKGRARPLPTVGEVRPKEAGGEIHHERSPFCRASPGLDLDQSEHRGQSGIRWDIHMEWRNSRQGESGERALGWSGGPTMKVT